MYPAVSFSNTARQHYMINLAEIKHSGLRYSICIYGVISAFKYLMPDSLPVHGEL
jgi:hypothetical protein